MTWRPVLRLLALALGAAGLLALYAALAWPALSAGRPGAAAALP